MLLFSLVLVAIILYFIYVYNRLVRSRSLVEEAWSSIDVQLKKRYNLIPNLIETVKAYASHEQETFDRVIQARNTAQKATGAKEQSQAEAQLTSAMANIFALSEAYPDLKSNTNFLEFQRALSQIEGDIEKARRYYNGTVRENNIMVESFPSNLLANSYNFHLAEYFELDDDNARSVPEVKF